MVHNNYPQIKKSGDKFMVSLEVSGVNSIINCKVKELSKENLYDSKIEMPLPLSIKKFYLDFEDNSISVRRVNLPGIAHFIMDKTKINDKEKFYNLIKDKMSKENYDAFGIMYYDYKENFMEPLVYVKSTDSLYWERSCASGCCALGAILSFAIKDSIEKSINQPGGNLKVNVEYKNEKINSIYLSGEVEIVSEGIAYV